MALDEARSKKHSRTPKNLGSGRKGPADSRIRTFIVVRPYAESKPAPLEIYLNAGKQYLSKIKTLPLIVAAAACPENDFTVQRKRLAC